MATLKLKPRPAAAKTPAARAARGPVRGSGSGVRPRPTLAEAQAERAEREARFQAERREPAPSPRPEGRQRPPARGRDDRPRAGPQSDARPRPGPRSEERPRPGARGDEQPRFGPKNDERPRQGPRGDERPRPGPRSDARASAPPAPGRNTAFGARPAATASHSAPGPRPATPEQAGTPQRPLEPPRPARSARPPLEPARRLDPARPRPPAPRPLPAPVETRSAPGSLRLSKYMGQLGLASRREADEWIEKGWVRVDGRVVSELGSRVMPGQQVTIDARARQVQAQKVTVLLNKPVGYVSGQAEDGHEPALVLVKPAQQWAEDRSGIRWQPQHLRSLVPAGRLDIDSTGLLVLTQDGRIAKQLIGEYSPIEKEYLVRVVSAEGAPPLGEEGLALLRHGLALDDEPLREAQVEWVNADQLRFVLREGKKRQIRRMCEAVGLQVVGLKRVRIGRVMLGELPPGHWRYLRSDESFG